jgi:hypothetical protein
MGTLPRFSLAAVKDRSPATKEREENTKMIRDSDISFFNTHFLKYNDWNPPPQTKQTSRKKNHC